VEGETDEVYLRTALETFFPDERRLTIHWVGRVNESGQAEFTGDSALNQVLKFLKSNPHHSSGHTVLLFDSDTNKPEEDAGLVHVRCTPVVEGHEIFRNGIENTLVIAPELDLGQFYDTRESNDNYGGKKMFTELNKRRLCDFICGSQEDTRRAFLVNLEELLRRILRINQ